LFSLFLFAGGGGSASANPSACYKAGDNPNLNAHDPLVILGGGIFRRDGEEYPFATYSMAERDSTDPKKICFRYEIENLAKPEQTNSDGSNLVIKSFRWKDIGLGFVDVKETPRVLWYKEGFTIHDNLEVATSNVAAFENSQATTTTLMSIEDTSKNDGKTGSSNVRPIRSYKVTEHYPSLSLSLEAAHIPTTSVISVVDDDNGTAKKMRPLVNKFLTGDLDVIVSSIIIFKDDRYVIENQVDFGGLSSQDVDLFAPTLQSKSDGVVRSFDNLGDLSKFVAS
jgi:hypothetical protein